MTARLGWGGGAPPANPTPINLSLISQDVPHPPPFTIHSLLPSPGLPPPLEAAFLEGLEDWGEQEIYPSSAPYAWGLGPWGGGRRKEG